MAFFECLLHAGYGAKYQVYHNEPNTERWFFVFFFFFSHGINCVVAVGEGVGTQRHVCVVWDSRNSIMKDVIVKGCDNAGKGHACYNERYIKDSLWLEKSHLNNLWRTKNSSAKVLREEHSKKKRCI